MFVRLPSVGSVHFSLALSLKTVAGPGVRYLFAE